MSTHSPVQWVPTTPRLTNDRFQQHRPWESPSAVVPEAYQYFDSPGTPAVQVPRTPQQPFRQPSMSPLPGNTPIPSTRISWPQYFKEVARTPNIGGEQIVPSTPNPDQATTPNTQATPTQTPVLRNTGDRRTPRLLWSRNSPSSNRRTLELFSGDDFFD